MHHTGQRIKLLNYRATPLQNKMPVVMAAYGRQHELREDLLRSRGLFGHFTAEECKFRWWKPAELVIAHMQIEPMVFLRPKEIAWQTIGNCIVQHHAFIAVYAAFDHIYGQIHHTFENILNRVESKRMTSTMTKLHDDKFAWYLGTAEQIDQIQKYVQVLAKELAWGTPGCSLPGQKNCFFDFELGCIPIDSQQLIETYPVITPTVSDVH